MVALSFFILKFRMPSTWYLSSMLISDPKLATKPQPSGYFFILFGYFCIMTSFRPVVVRVYGESLVLSLFILVSRSFPFRNVTTMDVKLI